MASGVDEQRLGVLVGGVGVVVEVAALVQKALDRRREGRVLSNPPGEHTPGKPKRLQREPDINRKMIAKFATRVRKVPDSTRGDREVKKGCKVQVGVNSIQA